MLRVSAFKPKTEDVLQLRLFSDATGCLLSAVDAEGHPLNGGAILHVDERGIVFYFSPSKEIPLPRDELGQIIIRPRIR